MPPVNAELSMDARVLIHAWFSYGDKCKVEVGGVGAQSVLSERGQAAINELVAAGFIVAEEFNRFGRMRYVGTELCRGQRLSLEEIDLYGAWSATVPNPATQATPRPQAQL